MESRRTETERQTDGRCFQGTRFDSLLDHHLQPASQPAYLMTSGTENQPSVWGFKDALLTYLNFLLLRWLKDEDEGPSAPSSASQVFKPHDQVIHEFCHFFNSSPNKETSRQSASKESVEVIMSLQCFYLHYILSENKKDLQGKVVFFVLNFTVVWRGGERRLREDSGCYPHSEALEIIVSQIILPATVCLWDMCCSFILSEATGEFISFFFLSSSATQNMSNWVTDWPFSSACWISAVMLSIDKNRKLLCNY